MKQYLLRAFGLATLTLLLHAPGFAQQNGNDDKDASGNELGGNGEIVIKHKNDKDAKFTIEIRQDKVYINGVPLGEYNDDNISVHKRKVLFINGHTFNFSGPDDVAMADAATAPSVTISGSPFRENAGAVTLERGLWSERANMAFLGVTSVKLEAAGETGAEVTQISAGSPAAKAGLKAGDIITKLDDLAVFDPQSLSEAVHLYKPGDKVTLTLKREGKVKKITLILGKSPIAAGNAIYQTPGGENLRGMLVAPSGAYPSSPYPSGPYGPRTFVWGGDAPPRLGIKAEDTEDGKGVKVLEIGDASAAEKAGIAEGDVITRFDGKEVNDATELAGLARESRDKHNIKIGLLREGKPLEVEIKIPRKLRTANL